MNSVHTAVAVSVFALASCNVSPTIPKTTGGVVLPDAGPDANVAGDGATACDRGTTILLTDYTSTQIALAAPDGTPLSPAFLSTASTTASGLAYALSGDVALPNTTPMSGRAVLIDSYGTHVITWADPQSADVLAQLPVGTGFESNPQDYLELDSLHAYVSRFGDNEAPGAQAFDSGSDVLVLSLQMPNPSIIGSIAMPVEEGLPPRPSGMVRVGAIVIVVLQRISDDFSTYGESALVGLSNDAIAWEMHVTGLKNCGRPAISPSGARMALPCVGALDSSGAPSDLASAGIAILDVTNSPPTILQEFKVSDQLGSPPDSQASWMSETVIVGKTQTPLGASTNNQAFALDTTSGLATVLLTAQPGSNGQGEGVVYGDVRCSPGCGNVCMLADSETGLLHRWQIAAGGLQALSDIDVDPDTGLPPVGLSGY